MYHWKSTLATFKEHFLQLRLATESKDYIVWPKDNTTHPRNWTLRRKAFDIGLVSLLDLFAVDRRRN